jgi:hypothetical protein
MIRRYYYEIWKGNLPEFFIQNNSLETGRTCSSKNSAIFLIYPALIMPSGAQTEDLNACRAKYTQKQGDAKLLLL